MDVMGRIEGAVHAVRSLEGQIESIERLCAAVIRVIGRDGTIYTCGNGGSAAHALHLAEELIGRYRADRAPRAAVCLNADPTALTCIANDYGFDSIFARQARALLREQDLLFVMSTSGNSPNVVAALEVARERGVETAAFLGRDGGACLPLCDHPIVVQVDDSAHIQEAHQVLVHLVCEAVERLHA